LVISKEYYDARNNNIKFPRSYPDFIEILGGLNSWSPEGLSRSVIGQLNFV